MGVEFTAKAHARTRHSAVSVVQQVDEQIYLEDWPVVPEAWLRQTVQRLTPLERELMLRHKIVAYSWSPDCTVHCVMHEGALKDARNMGLLVAGRVLPAVYKKLVRQTFAADLQRKAVVDLSRTKPWASARRRLDGTQKLFGIIAVMVCAVASAVFTLSDTLPLIQLLAGLFFLMVVCLRSLCLFPLPRGPGLVVPLLHLNDLPVYTVLVPLFRETEVLTQLIGALTALQYPALCIKRTKR